MYIYIYYIITYFFPTTNWMIFLAHRDLVWLRGSLLASSDAEHWSGPVRLRSYQPLPTRLR